MDTSKVSSKWQVVIPRNVREAEQIRAGKFVATRPAMADLAYEVLLQTGIRIQPLPIREEEWEHPEAYSNPRLLHNIDRDGIGFITYHAPSAATAPKPNEPPEQRSLLPPMATARLHRDT